MSKPENAVWAETALLYLEALDAGDAAALAEFWERAAENPHLEQVLSELTGGLADLKGPSPGWEIEAERVRSLLREHLPSGFRVVDDPPTLTVRDVAARLHTVRSLGARFLEADRSANARLLADTTPLPAELGLVHFEKWRASLGVDASSHYWRAFRQAAVLLAMGRCQQASELAAARRAVCKRRAAVSQNIDGVVISAAIQRLFDAADLPWPPSARRTVPPVPLDTLIQAYNLTHDEVPGLSRAAAGSYLARWGVQRPELLEDTSPLAGFLFANAHGGCILIDADDPLPRRRFSAAHELGHYVLHFLANLQARPDDDTYLVQYDKSETVHEEDKESALPERERQANQLAAELLMPEAVCHTAIDLYTARFRAPPRFLEHSLASSLLVSREAVRWRLRDLNITKS